MPVDRHVERVAQRVGLIGPKASADDAHDLFLGMLQPDQMYEAHVNLIQHGRVILPCPPARLRRLSAPAPMPVRRPQGPLTEPSGAGALGGSPTHSYQPH